MYIFLLLIPNYFKRIFRESGFGLSFNNAKLRQLLTEFTGNFLGEGLGYRKKGTGGRVYGEF
jgi:hypothetical protein